MNKVKAVAEKKFKKLEKNINVLNSNPILTTGGSGDP